MPQLAGIHHVKIPVTDVSRSLAWYERVFGLKVTMEFKDDDGVLRGLVSEVPGLTGTLVALRENPKAAEALSGFDPISFAVQSRADVEAWAAHLDEIGVEHPPVVEAAIGWILILHDPDGIELHVYSWDTPGESKAS